MSKRKAIGFALVTLGVVLLVLGLIPWQPLWTDISEIPMIVAGVVSIVAGMYKVFAPKGVRDTRP